MSASGRSSRALGAVSDGSRQIRGSGGGPGGQRGQSRGSFRGGGGRPRDSRSSRRGQGGSRGRGGHTAERERRPDTPEGWERRIASEANEAFVDLTLCFKGTGIPVLEGMRLDLANPGSVGGQEIQAMLIASCHSMTQEVVNQPDGSSGRRIRSAVIEEEFERVNSGG